MRLVAAILILAAVAQRAAAEEAPPVPVVGRDARTDVAVTVYNQDLAFVRDTRELEIPSGESGLRFEDVAAKIDPRTVAVRSLVDANALAVLEQTYVFDLISSEKLLEKYVGQEIELVETGERLRQKVTKATLLASAGGLVFRVGDRIAIGHPGRIVLPKIPEALSARPTLVWRLANTGRPRQRIEVLYLTGGLGWAADYTALVNADDTRADLTAWVTLTNESGARYDDATVKLVAGQVNRARPKEVFARAMRMAEAAAPASRFAEEAFDEYHLYTLDRRATLLENETTQMRLLAATAVPLKKTFLIVGQPAWYRSRVGDLGRDVPVGVYLELTNDAASHLGMPLPAGTVRVFKQDKSGAVQFVGEDTIRHTPKDERVVLKTGEAFDVAATRVQTDFRAITIDPYEAEAAFAVTIRNHKREAVAVSLREPVGGEWKVTESSHPPTQIDAGTLGFEVKVPADGETVVSYRVQIGFRAAERRRP